MDVKQLLAKIVRKHGGDWLEKIPAITGNRAGVVDAGDGKIWIRFSTGVEATIINNLAPLAPDRHILIGRIRSSPNVWRVAEIRETYLQSDESQTKPHHLQHELGGFDQLSIHRKQIISATAFVSDSENFLVRVFGGLFQTDSGWVLAESTDGTIAHPDLDLSAEVPATGAVYVGIEADSTGALSLNVGAPFASPELGTGADVPIPPDGSRLIAFVLLYDSQVELLDSDISVPGLFAGGAGGSGAAVWGAITGTITDQTDLITEIDDAEAAAKSYADSLVVGLWDDRGSFDAGAGAYPSSGGSGTAGAILKGDIWTISVAGTLPTGQVVEVGDIVRALVDTPGNTQANWAITQNNIGYVAENTANKATTMSGNESSNIIYLTAKAIYDWATALFYSTAEQIQDIVGGMVASAGVGSIIVIYNDTTGELEFSLNNAAVEAIGDARYAFIAEGVTNGDGHNHTGGDGGTIAYSSLSGRPVAETNANDIYRCDNPGGTSLWTGTISGAPSGASVTVSAPATGTEAVLVPTSTSQIGKLRLYNLTRGNHALISNYNTGTNVVTLTANAPANWASGDSLTIASQTVSGSGIDWVDIEITSGPTGKLYMFMNFVFRSATIGNAMLLHPFETFAASKSINLVALAANLSSTMFGLLTIVGSGNVFTLGWTGTPTFIIVREAGYLE